jgi:tetratricopeptide (TPR) repeat protein
MKLKTSKGIQDFNRALAIIPGIFQAYLSWACYYGTMGNYTKAILSCNEAIKLQANSVGAYLYRWAKFVLCVSPCQCLQDRTQVSSERGGLFRAVFG